jgi:hypothetical protein
VRHKTADLKFLKRTLFLSCALTFLAIAGTVKAGPATEKGDVEIMRGQRGKYIFFKEAAGIQLVYSSPDTRYIGGGRELDNNISIGFVYDIVSDSFFSTYPNSAQYIYSPNLYAGDNRIVKNGQVIPLDPVYHGTPSDYYESLGIWAATPNLDKFFVMGYNGLWDNPGNRIRMVNLMFVYDSDGHVLDTIKPVWDMETEGESDVNAGYGERINACNSDGTVLVGHSCYVPGNTNFTAAFWDLQNDTSFGMFESEENCWGTLQAVNNDGSIIVGDIASKVWLIRYDRQAKSYTKEQIPYSPGMQYSLSSGISETGLILYVQQTSSAAIDSRETYLYNTADGEIIPLKDYCEELYGVEINYPTSTGMSISDNGRVITGWTYSNAIYYPYAIVLDSIQLYARPRNVAAKQLRGTSNISVTWQLPIKSMHTLTGFDVYRDGEKINSSLISESVKSYEDIAVDAGVHNYSVKALYNDSVSDFSDEASVLVVEISGCLPVQKIESNVVYNRTVQVNWGLPSSQISDIAAASGIAAKSAESASTVSASAQQKGGYVNNNLDIISMQEMKSYTSWSAIVVGDKLLVGENDRSGLKVYDAETYEFLETIDIDGVSNVYCMAVNGNNLYIANNTKTISIVNLTNMTLGNIISNRETNVLHIAYSPDLNGGSGGLYYGNAENLFSCNRMGLNRDTIFMNSSTFVLSGTAYYDSALYMFSQTGKNNAQMLKFDVNTETVVWTKELNDYPKLSSLDKDGFLPVGLTLCVLPDSTIALGGMISNSVEAKYFTLFELLSSPSIEGYNLYRDSVKLNDELIKGHYYEEDILSADTYTYTVEAVNSNGCRAMQDGVQTSVTIYPIGTCSGPRNLTADEIAHSAVLNWELPEDQTGIVGFNIYKNGNKVADKIIDIKYIDFKIDTGHYTYVVEAFYQNSCVAADTVEITIKNEGEIMPPLNLAVTSEVVDSNANNGAGEFNVSLTWDLPYFEAPLALGFSNIPYSGIALSGTQMWAAIGWDRSQLDGYEDLYVIGMEYFIGTGIVTLDGFVFLNDTLVYMKRADEPVSEGSWNVILFDRQFSMNQPLEVALGYKVTYENSTSVAVMDLGPKKGYSDLVSVDGVAWYNMQAVLGYDNNWCINALVVRKRDVQQVMQKNGAINIFSPLVKRIGTNNSSIVSAPLSALSAATDKTASATLRLNGFNIYRNDVQQNSSPETSLYYNDSGITGGDYSYRVSAVYNEGAEEVSSEPIVINLTGSGLGIEERAKEILISAYPNPANQVFYVNGDYKSLQITDLTGVTVKKQKNAVNSVYIGDLSAGTYLLRFTLHDSSVVVKKLVVR